ncbi:MAG: hypothetical protein NZ866_01880 [Patescibacteria group bacterium]|nr:hypothetical protein [Patescibacteria group bacterium]
MIIKKTDDEIELDLEKTKIFFDPSKIKEGNIIILSDPKRNLNTNKFFNLSGEYETGGVYFRSYFNKDKLIFVFKINFTNLVYLTENLTDEILTNIFNEWGEIDIALINCHLNDFQKIKNKLKFKVIIDINNKNNLKGEKIKTIKINFKKIEEKNFILI